MDPVTPSGETLPGAPFPGAPFPGALRRELTDRVEEYFEDLAIPQLFAYGTIACLSPSFDREWAASGALGGAATLIRDFAAHLGLPGLTAEIVRLEGRTPVVLVEVPATDPTRIATTLVYGHLDKQPPLGSWREGLDPFRPVREGDLLYGRGMADDGYAAFAALGALRCLHSLGMGHGRVVLLVEASEESGSPDLAAYLDHLAGRLGDLALVVCLDSGGPTFDRLWVTTSLRGNLVVTLTVEVLTEGVHSGIAGGVVPSSFRLVRQLLSRIEDPATGDIVVPELSVAVPPHRRQEMEMVAAELGEAALGTLPTLEGLRLEGKGVADQLERVTWHPALSVIGAEGLPSPEEGGNVLLPLSALKLSIRLPPTCDAAAGLHALEGVLLADPPSGAKVRLSAEQPAQGWDAPLLAPDLAAALDAASRAHLGRPSGHLGLGGSIPFLSFLAHRFPDAQLLATGVLGPSSNAHGPNEALTISAAKAVTACLAELVTSLASPGAGRGHP